MTLIIKKPTGAKLVMAKGQPVPVDQYFGDVSLLLHGDGANNSTTITDSSRFLNTVTTFGDAKISTAQSKFGASSIALDGTGDYLRINSVDLFRLSSNFTIECWLKLASLATNYSLLCWQTGVNVLAVSGISTQIYAAGGINVAATINLDLNWHHFACVRSSGVVTFYIDGTAVTNNLANSALSYSFNETVGIDIGRSGVYGSFNGYIDELRITKGVARYTSNFTPPTAPFPDI